MAYVIAMRRVWLTEWRHTLLSARREWPTRTAVRMWVGELAKGVRGLPAHAREIRGH